MSKSKSKRKQISAEQFIDAWQKASSPEDVVKALGISRASAVQKASVYRRKGVKSLKHFPSARGAKKLDYAALNTLAGAALKGTAKKSSKRA